MNKLTIALCLSCLLILGFSVQGEAQSGVSDEMLSSCDTIFSATMMALEEDVEMPEDRVQFIPTDIYLIPDDPIAAMLDSLSRLKHFETFDFYTKKNILNTDIDMGVPFFSDSIITERLEQLNQNTTMELSYNAIVARYIELYANKRRELTSRMLGLSEVYFPMFEEMMDKYDVPLEMKYLAIVESALNPTATSRAGAKGLWQFMYATGKMYGLEVSSVIDDRCDPYKATEAAARYLKDLHKIYDNWELALAAYNCGPGNVNKAIRRSGGKTNYWQLWSHLPAETRGYVPAFIAVVYVMNYATEHNIYPQDPNIFAHQIDTVAVRQPLSFDQISEMLGIKYDLLSFLNPPYKKGIIPASATKPYILRLPYEYTGLFIMNEDSLYAYKTQKGIEKEQLMAELKSVDRQEMNYHKVKSGETLSSIAAKYRCSVKNLQTWNGLKPNAVLKIGQRLIVYAPSTGAKSNASAQAKAPDQKVSAPAVSASTGKTRDTYVVQAGDNLWGISQKYPGVSVEDIKAHNGLSNNNLKVGQTLKIPQ
ncbi:MAG: LysM peptidoglycan-binding domain-containing protein [Bacteroidales bacterium]|nr:LysM peptidoglycan-binding domain-containing protein [Bacteroidales bacterium]